MKRVSVRYDGCVQGVGFRYTACAYAQRRHVTGFVRNEYDGSVFLVAEGAEEQLQQFLDDIRGSHLGRYIRNEDVNWSEATGDYGGFIVAH